MMPIAPSERLALRLLGAAGTSSTFCDSSACAEATCTAGMAEAVSSHCHLHRSLLAGQRCVSLAVRCQSEAAPLPVSYLNSCHELYLCVQRGDARLVGRAACLHEGHEWEGRAVVGLPVVAATGAGAMLAAAFRRERAARSPVALALQPVGLLPALV